MPLNEQQKALMKRAKENLEELSRISDMMEQNLDAMKKDDLEGFAAQVLKEGLGVINQGHLAQARVIDALGRVIEEDEADLKKKEEEWRLEDAREPKREE